MAGRKPKHYVTKKDGTQIKGLSRRPCDGRWRVIGTDITFVESDEQLAIFKFRTKYAPKKQQRTVALPSPPLDMTRAEMDFAFGPNVTPEFVQSVMEEGAFAWFRQLLLTEPKKVALKTGIEQLGYLEELKPPPPSPTLEEVGQTYLDRIDISANWRTKSKKFWAEFTELIGAKTLRELTQEDMVDYADMVLEADHGRTYVRQRFSGIKAIINYPRKLGKSAEDCNRALAYCAVLSPPPKSAVDPTPISREDFANLLKAAQGAVPPDPIMPAMLLLMLNCCMYAGEVAVLSWPELDLAKGTLVTQRPKTGIIRVAALWPRTIAALKALDRGQSDAVFTAETGSQANYKCVYRRFKSCRTAAGVAHVQLGHIRDGAYTAAVAALPDGVAMDITKLLAGHASGMQDHYVRRKPEMVTPACAAVEKAYFG